MNRKKTLVYPHLPRAGLGNMLIVWAKAVIFADINGFLVVEPNWNQIKIGPYLRGEKHKRRYANQFCSNGYVSKFQYMLRRGMARKVCVEPEFSKIQNLKKISDIEELPDIYMFNALEADLSILKEYQLVVSRKLFSTLHPVIVQALAEGTAPEIGIHVRLSDFNIAQTEEEFASLGGYRTPLKWYIEIISKIRAVAGYQVPATVFSDGHDYELQDLLSIENVSLAPHRPAILDIFLLSKSKILITSANSSFSAWASYLGQCPTIWHPDCLYRSFFSDRVRKFTFEGGVDPRAESLPALLIDNIKSAYNTQI
jgi:hypothetical protein